MKSFCLTVALVTSGCFGCSELRRPAAMIAEDLGLYMDHVAPCSTLTTAQALKVDTLGRRLRGNVELLRDAAR